MVKRFTETVDLQPLNLSTGAGQGISSLADRLESFKQSTADVQTTFGAKKGQAEAAEVDIETVGGEVQAPELRKTGVLDTLLTGGARTQAYNKTLRDGYMSAIENDSRLDLANLEMENPDNITAYNSTIEGYVNGVLKGVDPSLRPAVEQFLNSQVTDARIRIQAKTLDKNRDEANSSRMTAIDSASDQSARLAREGNAVGAGEALLDAFTTIDGMVETGDISEDKAIEIKRNIEREATEQGKRFELDNIAETEGMDKAFEHLESIRNDVPNGWTPDEWDTFVGSAQADLNGKHARIATADSEISLETSREISNLKIQARTGVGEPSEIIGKTEELFNQGVINEATRTSIITNVINGQKETFKDAASREAVAARLSGNAGVMVSQDDVDLVWNESLAPAVSDMSPTDRNASIAQFVDETKRIPTLVKNQITSNLNSFDTELVIESAGLMDRLDGVRGIPEDNFSPNQRAFAETIVLLQQNLTPEESVKLARQNTDPNDQARVEARTTIINNEKWKGDYVDWVDDAFDPFLGADLTDPVNEAKLTKEFGVLFEEHFKAGMDESAARDKALQILERNWGRTDITGKPRATKYPPEDYYTVAGNSEYMGEQLINDVRADNVFDREITKDMVLVTSDETTARTASTGAPTYAITINMGEDGLLPLVGVRWSPDMKKEIDRQMSESEKRVQELRTTDSATQRAIDLVDLLD